MKKKKATRMLSSTVFVLGASAVLVFLIVGNIRVYLHEYTIQKEIAMFEQELTELEHRKLESLELLDYVATDAYVEQQARESLSMKKPGEKVFVVKGLEQDLAQGPTHGVSRQGPSNPLKWWYYFTQPQTSL